MTDSPQPGTSSSKAVAKAALTTALFGGTLADWQLAGDRYRHIGQTKIRESSQIRRHGIFTLLREIFAGFNVRGAKWKIAESASGERQLTVTIPREAFEAEIKPRMERGDFRSQVIPASFGRGSEIPTGSANER